jgi:hypothetical protein
MLELQVGYYVPHHLQVFLGMLQLLQQGLAVFLGVPALDLNQVAVFPLLGQLFLQRSQLSCQLALVLLQLFQFQGEGQGIVLEQQDAVLLGCRLF